MKKNIQINLFNTLYNIDEDAYLLLENYLESMKRYFSRQEGGAEIADDIEHRVAELLWARKESGMETVSNDVIREIIAQIGNPEEIAPENDTTDNNSGKGTSATEDWKTAFGKAADGAQKTAQAAYEKVRSNTQGKKLYRDPNDKVLGGVCSGLAMYFGGDVVLWRVILAALFILEGFGLILYIILWIVVPQAITPEDRLRMKGSPVTPDTLNAQILNDQHISPTDNNGAGCLKTLFIIMAILICIPIIMGIFISIFGCIAGLGGGFIGGFFGLIESILSVIFHLTDSIIGNTGAYVCDWQIGCHTTKFSTPLFLSGIAMLVIALILIIYCIAHAVRSHSKPLGWGARILIGITIAVCLMLGGYNIHRSHNTTGYNWHWGPLHISTESNVIRDAAFQ